MHLWSQILTWRPQLINSTQRSMDLAQEKCTSNWLKTRPIDENVEYAISCPFGGFPSISHNEIRDLCHNVSIGPNLQAITGETFATKSANTEDGARSDIAAAMAQHEAKEETGKDGEEAADIIITAIILK
ncbi:hypothetical protein EMCRGX_G016256 [Ephydatia muelleri]